MGVVNIREKLARIDRYWSPRILAELNGQHVKIAKLKGEFVWHRHEAEDELFFVIDGRLRLEFRDRVEELGPGECLVVPRGVEHRPVAPEEVSLLLFEPISTVNTGSTDDPRRVTELEWA
jgi:mannose-6-phosphate isomerase-like protein (cupin superfamily)